MGEIADMILEGLLCEETGELIDGEAPGYPRSISGQAQSLSRSAKKRLDKKCAARRRRSAQRKKESQS